MSFFDTTKDMLQEKVSGYGKTYLEHKDEVMKQKAENKKEKEARKLEKFASEIDALPLDQKQELFNQISKEVNGAIVKDFSELEYDCLEDAKKRESTPREREMTTDSATAYLWAHALGFSLPMGVLMTYFAHNTMDGFTGMVASVVLGFGIGAINGVNYKNKTITNKIADAKTKKHLSAQQKNIDKAKLLAQKMSIINDSIASELENIDDVDKNAVTYTNTQRIKNANISIADMQFLNDTLTKDFKDACKKQPAKSDEMER